MFRAVKRMGPRTRADGEPLRVPRCKSEKQEGDQRKEEGARKPDAESQGPPGLGS